ncbi:hypothetical protein [Yinghuangia aomiensis]|uniref:hypothetical protein n=1 Tax=Yinghuangia aomiensis TaxID=676205 RepID=UPI0031E655A5
MPPPAAEPPPTSPAAESDSDKVEPGLPGFTVVALTAALTWVPAKRMAAGFRRPDRAGLPQERPGREIPSAVRSASPSATRSASEPPQPAPEPAASET